MKYGAAIRRPESHDNRAWILLLSNKRMNRWDRLTNRNYYYLFISNMCDPIFKYAVFVDTSMVEKARVIIIFDELDYTKSFNAE